MTENIRDHVKKSQQDIEEKGEIHGRDYQIES